MLSLFLFRSWNDKLAYTVEIRYMTIEIML